MADVAHRSIHGRQTVRFVRVPCCVSCLVIGTSQPKQRIVPNQLSQHVYDVGASYPQEPRRQIHGNVKKSPHRGEWLTHEREGECVDAVERATSEGFMSSTWRPRSLTCAEAWKTLPVRCEEPHVENVAPTSDLVVTLATGIVPISHASRSHHDQRWPGQQLPDGMRALDGREAWEGRRRASRGVKLFRM